MKRFLLLTVALVTIFSAQAQRTITGKVIDSEQKESVIQGTVALLKADSSLVANALTNMEGLFSLTAPSNGRFILKITYIGYKDLYHAVNVEGKPVNVGTLTIAPDTKMLKEVEVVKNVAKVYSKEDTLIYNATAYKTPEGSVVEELVKKLPGAEVGDDGSIKINGKTVQKILVDGKEFMTGDTKTAIKNLPTSIVDRIKTYDEKSDLSRVTGIDDGNDQTVLDFGLKRGMNRGMFANIDAGIGTNERYSSRAMAAMMKDNWRVMGFASANNVNDMGFGGGGGGGRFGGGGRNGLQASKMGALNFNYEEKNKLKWDGSVRWNHGDGDAWSRRSTENFVSRTGSFSESVNQNYSRSNSWNAQMRVEWMPDTLWNISFRPSWSFNTNDGTSSSASGTFSDDPYNYVSSTDNIAYMASQLLGVDSALVVNQRQNGSLSYSDSKRLGGTLQLNRKLGGGGRNITLRMGGNYNEGASESFSRSLVDLYQLATGDSTYQRNRYNVTPTKNYDYNARITYSEPILPATFLQFSYNFQYRFTESDRSTYDFWSMNNPAQRYDMSGLYPDYREWDGIFGALDGHNYTEFIDDSLSRFSQYKNYIHTGEVMLRVIRKAYNFNVGVQIIPQHTQFSYRYMGNDIKTDRDVVNWSPTANFRWKISDRGQMRFEYRGSTSQPSMTDLLPITDNSDPLNITSGNPGLKPSFTQRFNWRFNNYYERHQRFVFANLNFSTTSNSVANMVKYDPVTGGRESHPENINGNWNVGGNFTFNTAIDTTGYFNVNTSTDVNYSNNVGYIDLLRDGNISKMTTKQTTIGERLGGSYRNDWMEFEINGGVRYNYVYNALQPNSNLSTWAFNYGFNTTLQAPWGMQFTTSLNMSSRRGYSDASANTNELIWNAQISQSFLKGKPLSVRLEFYDILGNQSNFSRSISAMSRTDNWYNSINSYVMLRATYRLNLFGTKEMRQAMRRGPEGGPEGERGVRGNRNGGFRGGRGGFGGGGFGGGRF
ncbi:outer membrane beta-barrel protein [Prevotella sp. E9-3]|uniref:outer membrane beta-barrel protein n=1 Tax=Prevotella sp. E9-3 TaxID=2913621 RepID=UPI001EDAF031|nr:outer membrane beta-barrel protein [Prevotella sp. E9-3]UKK47102.1 outer membrane beta-barrel protein [Prevotella sp. E9-3]